jgi:hypothetical protein
LYFAASQKLCDAFRKSRGQNPDLFIIGRSGLATARAKTRIVFSMRSVFRQAKNPALARLPIAFIRALATSGVKGINTTVLTRADHRAVLRFSKIQNISDFFKASATFSNK